MRLSFWIVLAFLPVVLSAFSPSVFSLSTTRSSLVELRGRSKTLVGGAASSETDSPMTPRPQYVTLAALSMVFISNQWSRSLIYYLVSFSSDAHSFEFMNIDLGFGAAQYGIVASFGFTLLFAVSSLFAGPITDRYVP